MKMKMIPILTSLLIFALLGCMSNSNTKRTNPNKSKLLDAGQVQFSQVIQSDLLKVIKKKNGKVENLTYNEAVIENRGTDKEKICLCQGLAFRVAQLASQAWSDGIFRSYEIKKIRTGWNTDGVFEFFSDQEYHGETGDLEIPINKIVIENTKGGPATPNKKLTIEDNWYEITFTNGFVLSFRGIKGANGIFTPNFMAMRNKFVNGNKEIKKELLTERKKIEEIFANTPFDRIKMNEEGIENLL